MGIQKSEGKLKIYFGYAAGVGKTYTMLGDAHEAQKNGIDVVVGYIEPHARKETVALIDGLENIPPLEIDYKGISLKELDVDKVIERKPELVLVDELAHTNAAGSRHKKRYQDVDELLRAGIDVYTTVNVQHIESLHDVVASITGISVNERIPDSEFDRADQIELIDLEPDELIDRLNKGKIYSKIKARQALQNFFTKQKLLALREIALRRTADQVTRIEAKNARQDEIYSNEYRPYGNEHILVCISSSSADTKVIRAAARMAEALHSAFTALFVETESTDRLDEKSMRHLRDNLRLAEQLGAQISTVYGRNVSEQIAEYARTSRVTKIVMGRSYRRRRRFVRANLVDKLSALAPEMDVYIIPDSEPSRHTGVSDLFKSIKITVMDVGKAIIGLTLCTLIGFWFDHLGFDDTNIIMIYILGVLINSLMTKGWIYGVVYSLASVLIFNFFFTEPNLTFNAYDKGYPVTFVVMLAASLITGTLTERIKNQARQSARKAYRTEVLLETNRRLEEAETQEEILHETARQLIKLLNRTIIFYKVDGGRLAEPQVLTGSDGGDSRKYTVGDEKAVAEWVFKNNKRAGATTNTLPAAKCLYLSVRSGNNVLAVVGIVMDEQPEIETYEKNLLIAMLGECSMAMEKFRANEEGRRIAVEAQQERLRANLLRAISHDLRTPLTGITGNSGMLLNNSDMLSEKQKNELYEDIYDDSMWLNDLVENLLAITRIENENVQLNMQPELLAEVIEEALKHVNRKCSDHHIKIDIGDEYLMAKMDAGLIMQVIINIVDNAIKYTDSGSHIVISARLDENNARVEISDDGNGISDEDKAKAFDMFFSAGNIRGDEQQGLGLGLYLCKAIINAHDGEIYIRDNHPKGTVLGFTIKAEEVDVHE